MDDEKFQEMFVRIQKLEAIVFKLKHHIDLDDNEEEIIHSIITGK